PTSPSLSPGQPLLANGSRQRRPIRTATPRNSLAESRQLSRAKDPPLHPQRVEQQAGPPRRAAPPTPSRFSYQAQKAVESPPKRLDEGRSLIYPETIANLRLADARRLPPYHRSRG